MVSAKSRTASHTGKQFAGPVGLPNRILPERGAMTIMESDDDAARLIACPETVIHFGRFDSRAASSTEYRAARRSDTDRRGNVSIDCDPRGQVDDTIYAAGCAAEVDEALERAGASRADIPWCEVADVLFDAAAASRAQRYAGPVPGDFLAAVREPAVQGLVGDAVHGAGGETVTQASIRILTVLASSWPAMFAPTAFDTGAARVTAVDLCENGGLRPRLGYPRPS